MGTVCLTQHAIDRYQERVARGVSRAEAVMALQQFVSLGRMRPTPRHWMSDRRVAPGTRFVYWAQRPGVCAILLDGAVVTVITAKLVISSPRRRLQPVGPRPPRQRFVPSARWRWDRTLNGQDEMLGEAA